MNVKQFASEMRAAIADIRSKGAKNISCDNLISYLNQVVDSTDAEHTQADLERYKAELQNLNESQLEMFRSVITAGQAAIKSSLLLNGGAAVALLAFMGHLTQQTPERVADFATCLLLFTFGALAIVIVSGFTYLSQWFYTSNSSNARQWGFVFNLCCIALGVVSYVLFAWGLLEVYCEFVHYVNE